MIILEVAKIHHSSLSHAVFAGPFFDHNRITVLLMIPTPVRAKP